MPVRFRSVFDFDNIRFHFRIRGFRFRFRFQKNMKTKMIKMVSSVSVPFSPLHDTTRPSQEQERRVQVVDALEVSAQPPSPPDLKEVCRMEGAWCKDARHGNKAGRRAAEGRSIWIGNLGIWDEGKEEDESYTDQIGFWSFPFDCFLLWAYRVSFIWALACKLVCLCFQLV